MFSIPQATLNYWAAKNKPKASPADVAHIETYINGPLPQSYVEFITAYGFVVFPKERDCFAYTVDHGSQAVLKVSGISHIFNSEVDPEPTSSAMS